MTPGTTSPFFCALAIVATLALASAAWAENVLVFAAASLTESLREIGAAYEQTSGHAVEFNFGSSNDLARQIKAGAPADVFFSADAAQMAGLVEAGLVVVKDRHDVLSNTLAVIIPSDGTGTVSTPADLKRFMQITVANPDAVPAGVYARKYLEGLGLWDELKEHVVPTVDVRAALTAVADGHAEAGIVYRTDAVITPKVKIAFQPPREQVPTIVYPLAPIAASKHDETAAVVQYLLSPAARKIYERHGFIVLEGD